MEQEGKETSAAEQAEFEYVSQFKVKAADILLDVLAKVPAHPSIYPSIHLHYNALILHFKYIYRKLFSLIFVIILGEL